MQSIQRKDSYYEEFRRQRGNEPSTKSENPIKSAKLLTDRTAYISFLEVQLERVTAACLTAQGMSERIDHLQEQNAALENKMAKMARLMQLMQESISRQEIENIDTESRAPSSKQPKSLVRDVNALKDQVDKLQTDQTDDLREKVEECVREEVGEWEERMGNLEEGMVKLLNEQTEATKNHRQIVRKELRRFLEEQVESLETKSSKFEKKIQQMHRDSVTKQEEVWETFRKEIHRQLRLDISMEIVQQMDAYEQRLLAQVRPLQTSVQELQHILAHDWKVFSTKTLERLEQHQTQLAASSEAITSLQETAQNSEKEQQQLAQDVQQRAFNAEQTCTRLAEDVLRRIDAYRGNIETGLESVQMDVKHELKLSAELLKNFKREMRRELQKREKTMSALMSATEQQIHRLKHALLPERSPHRSDHEIQSILETINQMETEMDTPLQ